MGVGTGNEVCKYVYISISISVYIDRDIDKYLQMLEQNEVYKYLYIYVYLQRCIQIGLDISIGIYTERQISVDISRQLQSRPLRLHEENNDWKTKWQEFANKPNF